METRSKNGWTQAFFGAGAVPMGWSLGLLTGVLLAQVFLGPVRQAIDSPDLVRYRLVRDFARELHVQEVTDDELLDAALEGMLTSLDEYSRYYDIEQSVNLDRETTGEFRGVGAVFRRLDGQWRALFPADRSPAARAGLRVGDHIVEVAGLDADALDAEAFHAALVPDGAGRLAMTVTHRDGTTEALTVEPDVVRDPSVRHVRLLDRDAGIGYVSVHAFSHTTSAEFVRAAEHLRTAGARSLIVDLRGNLGGVLDSAVEIAQRFVPEGVIVSTEGRGAPVVDRADPDLATLQDLDVVVLVDGFSASASEVLAGCLQDHRRAVLVGARTYGKGVVQSIRRFSNPDARAKVTSAYYYSPSRRNFERTAHPERTPGLVPDVFVELDAEAQVDAHLFLSAYAPPSSAMAEIEAWEADESRTLLEPLPDDAQMRAALTMLGGTFPG